MRTLLLVSILAGALLAQEPPTPPTFHAEANYVRVDVYPTRDGAPVADLRQEDFEILENKVPQKIEQFEHVAIRAGGAQATRREPHTVAESLQAAADPRARVFVLFLDTGHVEALAARAIRKPLVDTLERLIGADDLIAVMTPDMRARDITFVRRTATIDGMLGRYWWGERDALNFKDPIEDRYAACYPGIPRTPGGVAPDQGIAQEMILRRREKQTLDALEDLVRFARGVREERKAVIAITDGWRLYRPNAALARPIDDQVPTGPGIAIDPRAGKLTTDSKGRAQARPIDCDRDRITLAQIDDQQQFRELLDEANRANTSFYPVDPRGLVVFDEDIVPAAGVGVGPAANPVIPVAADQARLADRHTSLRTLADGTDGLAVLDTNDLARGVRRVVDDLSSYYLLGYYSNGKLDGKFHAIAVHVKRAGVQVRARRGYLAPSAASVTGGAAPAKAPALTAEAVAEARAIGAALGSLGASAREVPLRLESGSGWTPAGAATFWAVLEPGRTGSGAALQDWIGGGQADAMVVDRAGTTVAVGHADIQPSATGIRLALKASSDVKAGEYEIRIRVKATGAAAASNESVSIVLMAAPSATGAVLVRRGPTTGNREVPTADPRFRRTDRLRLDVATPSSDAVSARLLDRAGKALPIPVAASVRDDADGSRWRTAELVLTPLAPGDYLIELTSGGERSLTAFRVVP